MKQRICMMITFCLLIAVVLSLKTCSASDNEDPFWAYFSSRPLTSFLTAEDLNGLRVIYPEELMYIEETMDAAVVQITEEVYTQLKRAAVTEHTLQFSDLLNTLHNAALDRAVEQFNGEQATLAERGFLRGRPDQMEVRNRTTETLTPYQALKAEQGDAVAAGGSVTETISVGYEMGDTIFGYEIGTASVSYEVSYTLNGPSSYDRVGDYAATHRIAFAVLYGMIQKVSYDLCYADTGEVFAHYEYNTIFSPEPLDQNLLFHISSGRYAFLKLTDDEAATFSTYTGAINAICNTPYLYM